MATPAGGWAYADNARIATTFLGLAIGLVGVGLLAVVVFGAEAAVAAVALLSITVFLLVFSVLVFLPRLLRRGPVSFSAFSSRSAEEVEAAVRSAIEATGRTPEVELVRSRWRHPPRIVTADGIPARFRIEVTRRAAFGDGRGEVTEIVGSFPRREAAEARALRERISATLAGRSPPGE